MPAAPQTTTKESIFSTYPLEHWIRIGEFFLNSENSNRKIDNYLSYEMVYSFLLELASQVATLEKNPSLFEILNVLKMPNAQDFISGEAINPKILEYWQIKQKEATRQKEIFLEKLEKQTEALKKYLRQSVDKLNKKPVDSPRALAEAVVEEIGVQTDPELTFKKAQNLEADEKLAREQEIVNNLQDSIEESARELQRQGKISPSEVNTINEIDLSGDLPLITRQLTLPASQRQVLSEWLEQQITPVKSPTNIPDIISKIVPATLKQLPEINSKTLQKTSVAEIREIFKEAVIAAIAETAPDLGEIRPGDIPKIISALTPRDKTELESLSSILIIPKNERVVMAPSIKTEPVEVTVLYSGLLPISVSPSKLAPKANPLRFKTNGISIIEEIRSRLYREGINAGNASFYRNKILDSWSLYLSAQNITPEDIDFTIKRLARTGEAFGSPIIKELQEVRDYLEKFQEGLSNSRLEQIKKQGDLEGKKGNRLVPLPSQFGTEIIREQGFNPKFNLTTSVNSFFGKVFGRKTLFSSSGQTILINRLSFLTFRFIDGFKKYFFNTAFGGGIKLGLQRLAQNSMQGIFGTAKTIFKQGFGSIGKIGFQLLAPGIGSAALGLGKIIGALKLGKIFGSGLGFFGNFMSGLTGGRDVPKNKDFNFLVPVIAGVFVGLFIIVAFKTDFVDKGAFIQEAGGEIPGPPPVVVPPHCSDPRHLSEETICKLAQTPCSQNVISQSTWPRVNTCFDSISLTNKEIIRSWFNRIYSRYSDLYGTRFEYLQCLEFVLGIQEALGQNLAMPGEGTASNYTRSYPSTYKPYYSDPKLGDIVVWSGNPGHIAIVLDKIDFKIIVAQANSPYSGQIDVAERVGIIGDLGGPAVFLRYEP